MTVVLADASEVTLPASASKWTGKSPATLFKRGDLARIKREAPKAPATASGEPPVADNTPATYLVDQIPRGQAAPVSYTHLDVYKRQQAAPSGFPLLAELISAWRPPIPWG